MGATIYLKYISNTNSAHVQFLYFVSYYYSIAVLQIKRKVERHDYVLLVLPIGLPHVF